MESKKLLLIGGGGHCKSVLDCLLNYNEYDDIGIIEKTADNSDPMLGIPVIGTDDDLPALFSSGWIHAFVTLGSVGNTLRRHVIFENLNRLGFVLPCVIDPSAVIGRNVTVGVGVFIGKRAVINAGTHIGACSIINTGAIIEHDCSIGNFAHISPGCTLCGEVSVGHDTHIGAGSVVRQQTIIGNNSLIGAGSNIVSNIQNDCEAFGNPCKVVKTL